MPGFNHAPKRRRLAARLKTTALGYAALKPAENCSFTSSKLRFSADFALPSHRSLRFKTPCPGQKSIP
jgi:hypothetical protein